MKNINKELLHNKENSLNLIGVQLGEGLNWISGVLQLYQLAIKIKSLIKHNHSL